MFNTEQTHRQVAKGRWKIFQRLFIIEQRSLHTKRILLWARELLLLSSPNRKGRKVIQSNPETDIFKQQMRRSLQRETKNSTALSIVKNDNVYTIGEQVEQVYFIESGQVKLLMLSSEGKECMLAIHSSGDIFGELCLSG